MNPSRQNLLARPSVTLQEYWHARAANLGSPLFQLHHFLRAAKYHLIWWKEVDRLGMRALSQSRLGHSQGQWPTLAQRKLHPAGQ